MDFRMTSAWRSGPGGSQWSLSRVTAGPRKQIYGPRMSEWDGRGLPPAAAARMARFRADGVRTSLLDVPDMAAVSGVGLPPVGEVMGCMVEHIGWQGFGGCGLYGPGAGWAASWGTTVTCGQRARFAGYKPYVDALYRGYDTALARMLTEAQAMGADGVVGVRLSVNHLGQDNREFVALGTAVRAIADQILAHLLSVDAAIAAVALGVVSGSRPAFDNRISLDAGNLDRIIAGHSGRADLIDHVRRQAAVLCDLADQLAGDVTSVLVPSLILSNGVLVLDRPIPLADLIDGLAEDHVPVHARQLLDLRVAVPGHD
jgi:uncharacterized protein YbjQ (UPF0145 family)